MKISEAKAIVGKMVRWTMISQGIDLHDMPDRITEDLPTLLKANRIIQQANKRADARVKKIVAEKGSWKGSRKISMTIADRGIAALYVAANFQGDPSDKADILACHEDSLVFCLSKQMMSNNEEEEDEE
jgi:hypothetical protein